MGNSSRPKEIKLDKHLLGCSGPGVSSAYCGSAQKQAAPISSENEKIKCLTSAGETGFCRYERDIGSLHTLPKAPSKTALNLDGFNSMQ